MQCLLLFTGKSSETGASQVVQNGFRNHPPYVSWPTALEEAEEVADLEEPVEQPVEPPEELWDAQQWEVPAEARQVPAVTRTQATTHRVAR